MARIRQIKPEFFESEDVSALPIRARLTWIGLWTHCDDHGRTKDIAKLIKGRIWSMDDVSLRDIEADLEALAETGRIVRYRVGGRQYLAITNWHRHQYVPKPSSPKHPAPDVPFGVPEPGESGHCETCWEDQQSTRSDSVSHHSGSPTAPLQEDYPLGQGSGVREQGTGDVASEADDDTTPIRPDVDRLCTHLADRIEANGAKRPAIGKRWRDAARLMLDNDGRHEDQIHKAIDWCQDDEFWRSNILSMSKLREKYDQLRLQATRNGSGAASRRQQETDAWYQRSLERAQAKEAAMQENP